jgi:hypothetical protein
MGMGGGIAMLVVAVPAAVFYEDFFLSTDDPFPSYCLAAMNAYATTCGGIEISRGSRASASYWCWPCTEKSLSHACVKRSQALLCSSLCQLWLLKQESVQRYQ